MIRHESSLNVQEILESASIIIIIIYFVILVWKLLVFGSCSVYERLPLLNVCSSYTNFSSAR
jgi:hypothetical protein